MPRRIAPRDLAHVGENAWEALRLPASRKRALLLDHAWRRVAGEAVALRTTSVEITRGVLRIEVPDPRWAAALRALLPGLVGRLARRHPELGIRRFRVTAGTSEGSPEPIPPVESEEPPERADRTPERTAAAGAFAPRAAAPRSIEAIADRYLARFEGRRRGPER